MYGDTVQEPFEPSTCKGERVGGKPDDSQYWSKRDFRQGQTSCLGQQMGSLCIPFVLKRKSSWLGVSLGFCSPCPWMLIPDQGPRGCTGSWASPSAATSNVSWLKVWEEHNVSSYLGAGRSGKVFAVTVKFCLINLISITKVTLNNRYIKVICVCWDDSTAYSWQSVMCCMSSFKERSHFLRLHFIVLASQVYFWTWLMLSGR